MTSVVLVGAGGKMGARLARNLKRSSYELSFVENDASRRAAIERELGIVCQPVGTVMDKDVLVLAVPDNAIGSVAASLAQQLRPGSMLIVLDAAAPYAGQMPARTDLSYFVAHPCHPSMFNWEADAAAANDTFGGNGARQAIVCALVQGPDHAFALGADIASTFYAPVTKVHRATLAQMAILEPVLSESITATCLTIIWQAINEAARLGVPIEMSRDFILGHIYAEAATIFGHVQGARMSDGCLKAIDSAMPKLFQPDWRRLFDKEELDRSIAEIVTP
ncbi:MAG: NAD(P)-binding domain-containing protein [Devosia sp.]|uniref:phosphogluconate dehydrogenase C-terminal domain-containing protein n=1 Tax=Devosia sp. 66-22 TaxID=1895753 RepID=UPI000929C221|nr:phosphogluconate dehydrogenase C-terminal domain-containing protein [Devosia sp. 66-22]MBN9348469.1 NAD(P)-binding domain-containing protein [Devosia sp.]OJX47941.1 MAG: hypothetical protein BGO81_21570 [Devosia sp. 66-22]